MGRTNTYIETETEELERLRTLSKELRKANGTLNINFEAMKKRALLAESELQPTRDALNKLTAEKSKWIRRNSKL